MRTRTWQAADGVQRRTLEIVVDDIQVLVRPRSERAQT